MRCYRNFFIARPLRAVAILALAGLAMAAGPRPPQEKPLADRVRNLDRVAVEKAAWGSLRWLTSAKLDPGSGVTFGVVDINPGQSNPLHTHPNSDEVIYVVSGSCEQRVGNETIVLKPGDAVRIPAGVPHTGKALGDQPARTIAAYNTGERQFKPVEEKAAK